MRGGNAPETSLCIIIGSLVLATRSLRPLVVITVSSSSSISGIRRSIVWTICWTRRCVWIWGQSLSCRTFSCMISSTHRFVTSNLSWRETIVPPASIPFMERTVTVETEHLRVWILVRFRRCLRPSLLFSILINSIEFFILVRRRCDHLTLIVRVCILLETRWQIVLLLCHGHTLN
jgi:hypothetical protein